MTTTVKNLSDKELRDTLSFARSEARRRQNERKQVAVQSCNRELLLNLARSIQQLCPHPAAKVITQTTSVASTQLCTCCRLSRAKATGGEWKGWK